MCITKLVNIINQKQSEIIKLKTYNNKIVKELLNQNKELLKKNKELLKKNKELLSVETLKNNEILNLKINIQQLKKIKLINGIKSKYTIQLFP